MRNAGKLLLLFVVALLALGCPNAGWPGCLNDPCPAGKYRDSFCGCSEKLNATSPPPATVPKALTPKCACRQADGSVSGWFDTTLPNPHRYANTTVKIAAGKCEDVTFCPLLKKADGSEEWPVIANQTFWVDVKTVEMLSFPNGAVFYGLHGTPTSEPASAQFRRRPVTRIASADTSNLAFSEETDAPGVYCRRHCEDKDSLCLRRTVTGGQGAEIYKLVQEAIASNAASIDVQRLVRASGQASDPCKRGDILLSGGKLTNGGGECLMSIPVTESGSRLDVLMPGHLEGIYATGGGNLTLRFSDRSSAPGLQFESKGLNADYGGDLIWLGIEKNRLIGETTNGCIQLSF